MTLSTLQSIVAAFAISLPPVWYPQGAGPETPEQRNERVEMAARVVAATANTDATGLDRAQLTAMTLSIWFNESRFDWHVHAGLKSPIGNQDVGKARCLGQLQTWKNNALLTDEQWVALVGHDEAATARCASATQAYLWYHAQRCLRRDVAAAKRWEKRLTDVEVALVFAAYGAGKCAPVGKSTQLRVVTYRQAMHRIARAK
jgi:hypothetical protein